MKVNKPLRILQVVGSLDRSWGGLSLYVAELADQIAAQGHCVTVACQPGKSKEQWPSGRAEVISAVPGSMEWESIRESSDLVHVHGLWLPFCHRALAELRRRKKPHLLSVHGMLEPGALKFSAWKKKAALWCYQRKDLRRVPVLHATAESEVQTLRAFGLRQPIVSLPPGVRLPPAEQKPSQAGSDRQALFLGRIHPVKGILHLIEAWAAVRPKGWKLLLAGPDEGGHLAEVRQRLRDRKLEREVIYQGPVFGQAKKECLLAACLLVVPSLSENFGVVVAEGLAHSLPVITTTGTPWEVLVRERCGWWVPLGVDPLVTALREAVGLPPEKLAEMGQRGRNLADREFGWPQIGQQMSRVYSWLIGKGIQPDCMRPNGTLP